MSYLFKRRQNAGIDQVIEVDGFFSVVADYAHSRPIYKLRTAGFFSVVADVHRRPICILRIAGVFTKRKLG